jgi:hypothetical protein
MGAVLLPLAILGLMAADGVMRAGGQDRASARWVRCLARTVPSFWPAGSDLHYPAESGAAEYLGWAPGAAAQGEWPSGQRSVAGPREAAP